MDNNGNNVKQIITQFILIVFSVVLGLFLSERIEEQKKQRESEVLLSHLKSEVKDNMKILEDWVPYHQEMKTKLDSLVQDDGFIEEFIRNKDIFFAKLFTRGTFMNMFPSEDAWDIAKSHPLIVNIDYEKLLILSRIHKQQEKTFEPAFQMFDLLSSKDVNSVKDAKANLEVIADHMHELIGRERSLVYFYRKGEGILGLTDEGENNVIAK